ncbi:MAG TPA: tRNA-dihydrouridine synthase [Nitrospiria bacterium]|nr:tRNA-dihydrouridine synthase [Nitrospiria bacterium]
MDENLFWNNLPRPIVGLAPMDGVTDAAFRAITARHGGPDLSFTEFVSIDRIVSGYDPDLAELRYAEIERPAIAQVFGTDPEAFYRVAHLIGELGFDGIDINMGCPSKTVARAGAGAGLIRTPERAREILRRTRQGIRDWAAGQAIDRIGLPNSVVEDVRRAKARWFGPFVEPAVETPRPVLPVSVKTRLGYGQVVIDDWIPSLLSESPAAITLHGRTLAQNYAVEADWEAIARAAEIVRPSGTLILGNGDVRSAATAVRRIRETGVHGVLVGRAALGNPWFFRTVDSIRSAARSGEIPPADPDVSIAERVAVALEHAELFDRYRGKLSFRNARKYLAAYFSGFPGASELRRRLVRVESLREVESILQPVACA